MGPPDSAPRRRAPSRRRGELTLPRSLSSPRLRLDRTIANADAAIAAAEAALERWPDSQFLVVMRWAVQGSNLRPWD